MLDFEELKLVLKVMSSESYSLRITLV